MSSSDDSGQGAAGAPGPDPSSAPHRRPPTRRERFKPLELVGLAAAFGVFGGGVAVLALRDVRLALIFAGIAFIVGLLVLAMLALAAGAPHDPADGPVLDRERPRRRRRRP